MGKEDYYIMSNGTTVRKAALVQARSAFINTSLRQANVDSPESLSISLAAAIAIYMDTLAKLDYVEPY